MNANHENTGPVKTPSGSLPEPLHEVVRVAIAERATDVHIDPSPAGDMVRFRIDGIIHEVEFRFPNIRQLEVDEPHRLDMQEGLRVLLRMDPDVILIGEIRDEDSAKTAARAALAGRLVIATIHATDAAMAVDALRHYAVPRYLISGALSMVITQELMRRVCRKCASRRAPTDSEKEAFKQHGIAIPEKVLKSVGCPECDRYGYSGRVGVFEVTPVTPALAEKISQGAGQQAFRNMAASEAGSSLVQNALRDAANGTVSIEDAIQLYRSRIQEPRKEKQA